MEGELGFLFQQGNNKSNNLHGKINIEHELVHWSNQYRGELLYRQKTIRGQRSTSAQRWFFSSQMEYKRTQVSDRLFFYSDLEHDRFDSYNYEASLAAGWSTQLWKNAKSEFKYSIGPGYAFSPSKKAEIADQKRFIARGAMEYKLKLSEQAWFRQFLSTEADSRLTKTRSETSLSAKLNDAFALKLSVTLRHLNAPRRGREKLDSQTSVSLVYRFF